MAVPNYINVVTQCKNEFPTEWANAHTGNANTDDFIKIVAARIHAMDPRVGNNGKRGNLTDISDDALCFFGEGADHVINSAGTRFPASVIDVIGGAGGPNPQPAWNVVSDPNAPIKTGFVEPGSTPSEPVPVPTPGQPYPDEQTWWPQVFDVEVSRRYAAKGLAYPDNAKAFRWASRTSYDIADGLTKEASLSKHLKELEQELGI